MRRFSLAHILLFTATFATTLLAGALQQGVNPLEDPLSVWKGLPFSLTLLFILAAHEFGHYRMARRHGIDVTLPYFIPAPSIIGTFGAFIKMKSPIPNRRVLLDVGAAGPLAGLIVSVPILLAGLYLSDTTTAAPEGQGIALGSSLLFSLLTWLVHGSTPDDLNLILHPVAFSGWIGLLVTCLNLLPVGQLDGGHVAYAVLDRRQKYLSAAFVAGLLILGFTGWTGWLVWGAILVVMGVRHPPVLFEWIPLDARRRAIGWITLGLFVATFIPVPFRDF
ncbi:MAG: site-2 protease family protein [Syntrophaceae bacterium]|nr:site-2 protease family protein [Syntrophaceae bacterium]